VARGWGARFKFIQQQQEQEEEGKGVLGTGYG